MADDRKQEAGVGKWTRIVKKIRMVLLIAIICCFISSGLAGKKVAYVGAGLLAVYLGLTFLMEKLEKSGK